MNERGVLYKARRAIVGVIALVLNGAASATYMPATHYAIVGRIKGPPDVVAWDYATIDSHMGRLFVATLESSSSRSYAGEITTFELRSGKVTGNLVKDAMPHKVVILDHGMAAVADAATHSVLFFKEKTGRILTRVKTGVPPSSSGWHNPDFLLREPGTGLLIAVNHDSGSLALVNVAQHALVGRIRVGGILEAAAAGDHRTLFVNVASKGAIAVIDVAARRVVRVLPMKGCEEPTGIAFDAMDHLIISVCSNGLAKFVDPETGAELASIPVGKGADGVMFDARNHVVFIAGGRSGTLSVIRLKSRHSINLIQTLRIPAGTRLGAVDGASGRVYLPSAQYDLSGPRLCLPGLPPLPRVVPGSFALLVVAPIVAG